MRIQQLKHDKLLEWIQAHNIDLLSKRASKKGMHVHYLSTGSLTCTSRRHPQGHHTSTRDRAALQRGPQGHYQQSRSFISYLNHTNFFISTIPNILPRLLNAALVILTYQLLHVSFSKPFVEVAMFFFEKNIFCSHLVM